MALNKFFKGLVTFDIPPHCLLIPMRSVIYSMSAACQQLVKHVSS